VEQRLAAIASGEAPVAAPARRPRGRMLALAAGVAGLLLLAAFAAFAVTRRTAPPAPAEAGLVAIAPFDAAAPELQIWREGLTDILARDLDGAGPLRTVPPSVALRRWQGRADRPSAEALGARTGANIVVYGTLVRRGGDSVGIRATVLDRARNTLESDIEVAGQERRMGELADSLGVRILRVLGRSRAIASVRHVSIGSRSLPALRAFLRAEQYYRAGEWDSALANYDRAVTDDSTFALALRRMGWALSAGAPSSWRYAPQIQYMQRAVRFNRGLSPRDSVLLVADSLGLFALGPTGDAMIAGLYRAMRSLEELALSYPDDPSVWHELGERRFHTPAPLGGDPARALEALDRAIALDSGFAPAYMHTVALAMQLGQPERARGYARAFVARRLPLRQLWDLHLIQAILDSGGVHAPAVRRRFDLAEANWLYWVGSGHFSHAADPEEVAIEMLRELRSGLGSAERPASARDSTQLGLSLAAALAFRGHLREALAAGAAGFGAGATLPFTPADDPFVDLALLGGFPDSLVAQTFAAALEAGADWGKGGFRMVLPRYLRGLPWWFARGDTASLGAMVRKGAAIAAAKPSPVGEVRARYLGAAAGAYLELLRGDSAQAIRRFEAIPDTLCLFAGCFHEKLALARVLSARGDHRRAAAVLDQWLPPAPGLPIRVLTALERGRIADALGDRATATRHYRYVLDVWRRPDAALLPYVEEARAGLGEPAP
jgi:serine/threonine-protein kinase